MSYVFFVKPPVMFAIDSVFNFPFGNLSSFRSKAPESVGISGYVVALGLLFFTNYFVSIRQWHIFENRLKLIGPQICVSACKTVLVNIRSYGSSCPPLLL